MPSPQTGTSAEAQFTYYQGSSQSMAFIQNLSTSPLYVLFGTGCSTTNFNLILPGCSTANDGTGGSYSYNFYFGPVTVYSATTPNYVAWAINAS